VYRTLFGPVPDDPDTLWAVRDAGFDTMTVGFYSPGVENYDRWFDARTKPYLDVGFNLLVTGDDAAHPLCIDLALGNPEHVRHAVYRLVDTGRCVGIEWLDECAGRGKYPAGPDDRCRRLVDTARSVPGCPPQAWCVSVGQNSQNPDGKLFVPVLASWAAPELGDRLTVYSPPQVWGLPDLPGGHYSGLATWRAVNKGLALAPRGCRLSTLIPFCGDFSVAGVVQQAAWLPEAVGGAAAAAWGRGCEVARYYSYHLKEWQRQIDAKAVVQSVGTSPSVGPDRWEAARLANRLVAALSGG
jgi:hypothetical protein